MRLDVADLREVQVAFSYLPKDFQAIDILINNAGLARGLDKVQEGKTPDWDAMINTNVKGLLYVTREVLPGMLARNQGHVVNIGSIAGYEVYSGGTVYCATKFALRALSDGIKMDVHGSQIRVSEVDPGMVKTEFSDVRFEKGDKRIRNVYKGVNYLKAKDVADAIIFCVTRPPHVDIRAIKIYPTDQTAAHMVRRDD
jgi:3-hydroxy acid dehydrogenase / malonic semialdehyde reductase